MTISPIGWLVDRRLGPLRREAECLREELDALRSRLELGSDAIGRFEADRRSAQYQAAFDASTPLVSVCIATYNRADLLVERCLRSLVRQTWEHLEINVVGDGCTDDTGQALAALGDPRVRFVNRPCRSSYPADARLRWMVGGAECFNQALEMARGDFITHLDDDDEHDPRRVAALLDLARAERADVVWHPFDYETDSGRWKREQAPRFRRGQTTTSSVLYHSWFRRIPWDARAYEYREPADWNRFRKFLFLGARLARHPECLLRHFRERNDEGRSRPSSGVGSRG